MSHLDNPPQEEKTVSIKVSLLHNLAVTAVAAVALLLFARPLPASDSGAMEESNEEASMVATVSTPESEEATAATVSIVSGLEVVAQKLKSYTEEGVMPKEGDFTVVLACSLPLDNAKAFLADVKSKGAHQAVLMTYKEQNMIAYGSYGDSNEAYTQLQSLISNGCVASGWVMQVK